MHKLKTVLILFRDLLFSCSVLISRGGQNAQTDELLKSAASVWQSGNHEARSVRRILLYVPVQHTEYENCDGVIHTAVSIVIAFALIFRFPFPLSLDRSVVRNEGTEYIELTAGKRSVRTDRHATAVGQRRRGLPSCSSRTPGGGCKDLGEGIPTYQVHY